MKMLLSISLSLTIFLVSLFPNMDTHEFNEVSELMEHYKDHQQRANGNEVSIVDFIVMHYFDAKHDQSEDHSNLPFKDQHHTCSCPFYSIIPSFEFAVSIDYTIVPDNIHHSGFISYYYGNIWQPPQI